VTIRQDPYLSYNFLVETDGITRAGFQECSGLDSTQDPIEYREGNEGLTVRRLPGLNTFSNIVLKWGIADDTELWEWRQQVTGGKVQRRNGSIVLRTTWGRKRPVGISGKVGLPIGLEPPLTPLAPKWQWKLWKSPMRE
jgi:phage tail-like protein